MAGRYQPALKRTLYLTVYFLQILEELGVTKTCALSGGPEDFSNYPGFERDKEAVEEVMSYANSQTVAHSSCSKSTAGKRSQSIWAIS